MRYKVGMTQSEAKEYWQTLEAGEENTNKGVFPKKLQKDLSHADTLILAH